MRRPQWFLPFMVAFTGIGLMIDQHGHAWQRTLSLAVWLVLALALAAAPALERVQVIVVVIVATTAELLASGWWGAYEYRLENLPLFVPPGHGLVYLVGLRTAEWLWAQRHQRSLVASAIAVSLGWALLGLSGWLGRIDVAGAIAVAFLVVFLLRGRAPLLYAGVFFFVMFLEIWGTSWGTWYWAPTLPGLGIPDGNPPSGIAAGYVLFDIIALWSAPHCLRAWEWMRARR